MVTLRKLQVSDSALCVRFVMCTVHVTRENVTVRVCKNLNPSTSTNVSPNPSLNIKRPRPASGLVVPRWPPVDTGDGRSGPARPVGGATSRGAGRPAEWQAMTRPAAECREWKASNERQMAAPVPRKWPRVRRLPRCQTVDSRTEHLRLRTRGAARWVVRLRVGKN